MRFEQALVLGMANDRLQRPDAAACNAGAASRHPAATARSGFRRLAILHVALHLLDNCDCQMLDNPIAQEGRDVCADAAFVHFERRRFRFSG